MEKPFIILLHGPMGSGKTSVSNRVFKTVVPSARVALPDMRRMVSGNHRENADIARITMLDLTESYLRQNIPVIIDVVCKEEYITKHAVLAKKYDATFFPYFIQANADVRWDRVCNRTAEMMNVSVLPESKVKELQPIFEENKNFYDQLDGELGVILDTSDMDLDQVVNLIKHSI